MVCERNEEPTSQNCLPLEVPVVQSSSSKHISPTDLKKCETVARYISPLLKNRNPNCGTRNRGWVSIKIDSFMKNMALEAELDVEGRKLTNHSVRKTLLKTLKASNQPRSAIIGVTGHTSDRSLAGYKEGDEAEQRQISSIISSPVCQHAGSKFPFSSFQFAHSVKPYSDFSLPNSIRHFHGCQVTIN